VSVVVVKEGRQVGVETGNFKRQTAGKLQISKSKHQRNFKSQGSN
jgi:hypothetical protein